MSRQAAISYCHKTHDRKTVMISISDPNIIYTSAPFSTNENGVFAILRLSFCDADRPGVDIYSHKVTEADLMTEEDADKVVAFLNRNKDMDVIVHCDAGISRSAGVAAAIMEYFNNDDTPIFCCAYYRPNMWCYRKTLNAFYHV